MTQIERIIKLLSEKKATVSLTTLTGGLWGMCDFQDRELFIKKTLRIESQIKVLIHECLHLLNPSKSEKWVLKTEAYVYDNLVKSEHRYLKNYLRRLQCQSRK